MFASKQSGSSEASHEERTEIRKKTSNLSFEELLKIKEDIGSKSYNETLFGRSKRRGTNEFKRVNKNRPREVSSKLRPKQINQVIATKLAAPIKKTIPRDPRFDPLCGHFDDKVFKDNYKFVSDVRRQEKTQLENELKECSSSDRKKVLKFLIQRMDNQIREQKRTEMENQKKYEEKNEVREKLKKGEMPTFKKKSVKKLEGLIEKFENLKKTNKIQKHIERKSKLLSVKDRKRLKNQQLL